MTGLLLALALSASSPAPACIGPVCLTSPDTETVQNIWIPNEQRYGVGVIRNGRFVAAAETPAATPAGPAATGDALNYGILTGGRDLMSQQGYMSNDESFRPPTHKPDPAAAPADLPDRSGWATLAVLVAVACVLILFAMVIALTKGPP